MRPGVSPPASQGQGGGARGPGGQRIRDMSPEQRRAYFESLTPEQRAQMRARREARRGQRGGGEGPPPDGD